MAISLTVTVYIVGTDEIWMLYMRDFKNPAQKQGVFGLIIQTVFVFLVVSKVRVDIVRHGAMVLIILQVYSCL